VKASTWTFPPEAAAQHVVVFGKTGSGKTYAAKGLVEGWLAAGRRVCAIDPTGVWWGLRAGGSRPGFPVAVFGGPNADVPISPNTGAAIGELVGSSDLSCVIDLSELLIGQRSEFMTDFAQALYRSNAGRPLQLVIDEAHEFAPQNAMHEAKRMLHHTARLVSGGRSRGLRIMLISQRPAKLHKDVSTQCASLVALRLIAPQDREAVKAWIDGQGDPALGKKVLDSLASLAVGEGWVWFPEGGVLDRVKFPRIGTLDSSATPEDGASGGGRREATLAEVNLSAIRARLAEAEKEAAENDPKALRARIAELTKERDEAARRTTALPRDGEVQRLRDRAEELERQVREERQKARRAAPTAAAVDRARNTITDAVRKALAGLLAPESYAPDITTPEVLNGALVPPPVRRAVHMHTADGADGLTGPERKIIDALEHWNALGVVPTRQQTAIIAGYHERTKGFLNALGSLRSKGLIDEQDQLVSPPLLTKRPTFEQHLERINGVLGPREREILDLLLRHSGSELTRAQVAEHFGLHERTKGFLNALGRMRTLDVVEYVKGGRVRVSETVLRGMR
jgi:hypothetical protein